ncbi:hypothetical protein [Streptomyces sp. SYSU K21746]
MTHHFRTRRFLVFAASTAVAAGGVLLPTGAFAAAPATPATPHVVAADSDDSSSTNLFHPVGEGDTRIVVKPDGKPGKGSPGKGNGKGSHGKGKGSHGKRGSDDGKVVVAPDKPDKPVWVCVTAPCEPPSGA